MGRKLTDEEREMFDAFVMENTFCWACGIDPANRKDVERERQAVDYPRWLERHHIVKCCRVHARWNIFSACKLCHDLAEMHTIRHELNPLPYLKLEHVLWLKSIFDPEHYDAEAMQKYALRRLPEPTPPPAWFMEQLQKRKKTQFHHGQEEAGAA